MEEVLEAYTGLAKVYDEFMEDVPYEEWFSYIHDILLEYQIEDGLLLDLGCGTGKLTRMFRDQGYDMIGVDSSYEMLLEAREEDSEGILYLNQDMREFELYGTIRAIFSVCDCINYILEEEEVVTVFKLVNNYLDPKGLFIFDFNTTHKYRDIIGDTTIAENGNNASFIWENEFDSETEINSYALTIFMKTEENLYQKIEEEHFQRGYTLSQMKEMIQRAGLKFIKAFDTDTKMDAAEESERITIVCMEQGK